MGLLLWFPQKMPISRDMGIFYFNSELKNHTFRDLPVSPQTSYTIIVTLPGRDAGHLQQLPRRDWHTVSKLMSSSTSAAKPSMDTGSRLVWGKDRLFRLSHRVASWRTRSLKKSGAQHPGSLGNFECVVHGAVTMNSYAMRISVSSSWLKFNRSWSTNSIVCRSMSSA